MATGSAYEAASARVAYGGAVTHAHVWGSWLTGSQPGSTIASPASHAWYTSAFALGVTPRNRWRASKGSAPVGRFTRAFSDNTTDGWHRSMPVGIEVTAGTTATVAAMFILGASSTAEARATAAAVGAFVLGVAAVAQARATANATGSLTAGVTSVAQARATASATGTLTLGVTSVAQSLARATAVATFVLGLAATADSGAPVVVLGPGLVLLAVTWRARLGMDLTAVVRHEAALTAQTRHPVALTARTRHEADLTFRSH